MDWSALIRTVIGLGAPTLGQALGGPLGAAAGRILADALGAGEPTPQAVQQAIADAEPASAAAAAAEAEAKWSEALAQVGRAQVEQIGLTQRAEIASDNLIQKVWRPLYALELSLVECPGFALTLLHALWVGHEAGINGFANLSALLMAYFAARFGVLGVYVSGRSREKVSFVTGEPATGPVTRAVQALTRRS